MPEPVWTTLDNVGSAYEEQLDMGRPNGPFRHRLRGSIQWQQGRAPDAHTPLQGSRREPDSPTGNQASA